MRPLWSSFAGEEIRTEEMPRALLTPGELSQDETPSLGPESPPHTLTCQIGGAGSFRGPSFHAKSPPPDLVCSGGKTFVQLGCNEKGGPLPVLGRMW